MVSAYFITKLVINKDKIAKVPTDSIFSNISKYINILDKYVFIYS